MVVNAPTDGQRRRARDWNTAWGLALWMVAVASALWAQHLLIAHPKANASTVLYAVAVILGVAGIACIDRQVPLPEHEERQSQRVATRWQWYTAVLLLAAVSASVFCIRLLQMHRYSPALWSWIAGLSLATIAMRLTTRSEKGWHLPRPQGSQRLEIIAVLGVLLLAVVLRLPHLMQIPPEVHGDEAQCGLEARRILHGEIPSIFGFGWYGVPYLSFAVSAGFMRIFGDDLYGLRMASVFQGTLSILLTYLIMKRLFTARVAIIAAFLLAVSAWHIHFSRSGIHYMQALLATLVLFVILLRAFERQRPVDFLLAGFTVGVCFEVYFAARLAPVLAAVYVLYKMTSERRFLRRQWTGLVTAAFGAVLFLAPMQVAYAAAPDMFLYRTQGVFLLNAGNREHQFEAYRVSAMKDMLRIQAVNSLLAFNVKGETSIQYGHGGPLLDMWSGALFVLGAIGATLRVRRARYFLPVAWFWLTLLFGSMLTVDALFAPRVIAILPVLFLFSALVVDAGWRAAGSLLGRLGTSAFALLAATFCILAARANYLDYFDEYVQRMQPAGFNTTLSHFISGINDRYRVYLLSGNMNWFQFGVERFLIPNVDGVSVGSQQLPLPLDRVPGEKGVVFLIRSDVPDAAARLASIEQVYPGGREELHKSTLDSPLFYSYAVDHDRLMAANPDAQMDHARLPGVSLWELRPRPSLKLKAES